MEQFDTKVAVVKNLTMDMVLGRDFMKQNNCVIDIGKVLCTYKIVMLQYRLARSRVNTL